MAGMQSSSSPQVGRLPCQSQMGEKKEEEEKQEEPEAPLSMQQTKGSQLWHMLQKDFRHSVEKMKNEEMKVARLSHGLQHLDRVVFPSPVRHVAYDVLRHLFVVLDSENRLHLLKEDGTYKSCKRAPAPMLGLVYATQVDQFVAWEAGSLQVLDSSFLLLSQVQANLPIRCGLYSELLNQIVTAGDGNVTIWGFRYGFRTLQCRVALREGLGPHDIFNRLALDTSGVSPQRCFASCGTGAATLDITQGKLLSFKKELHSRVITDITYCEEVGCAVTASRDTTIKVWDENWNIQTVFVGHTAPVIAVTIYPQRPLIFSASQDGTIRTWNLDTVDQVDQVHVSEPVEVLEAETALHIISISGPSLSLWKINKLYSLYAPLGSPVKHLRCINLETVGNFPIRILCVCRDSTVRLMDAKSGTVLSMFFLEKPFQARDVAYCLPRETLFVLADDGTLLRVNTAVDPMVLKKSSQSSVEGSQACCLLLYSHTMDPERAYTTWLEVVESQGDKKQWHKLPLKMQDRNRYLLIMGHQHGLLSTVDWFSGRTEYTVEAHGSEQVTALAEYPTQTCVISAGADLTVKMWRLFPHTKECLVPLLCFSCATPALHMCHLGPTLAVAFQDPETVTYRIVYYNLMEQTRASHGPEDDPLDDITGLCCCPNLKLFASASRDGSVKLWDMKNQLLRHLKLNTVPESLAFANHQGDLLVGIERHLYLIHHNKFLPSYYKMKLLCAKFLEPIKDMPLPISDACFKTLVKENFRRLMHEPPLEEPGSPLPGAYQVTIQQSQVIKDTHEKTKRFAQMATQATDLELLQKGHVTAAKKLRFTKEMREEAFERYLRIFYREQPKVEIPAEDPFDADEVLEKMQRAASISELYGPGSMFLGSFPRPSSLKEPRQMLGDAASPSLDKSPPVFPATASRIQEALEGSPSSEAKRVRSEKVEATMSPPPLGKASLLEPPPKERRLLPLPPLKTSSEIPPPYFVPAVDEVWTPAPSQRSSPRSTSTLLSVSQPMEGKVRLSWQKVTLSMSQEFEMASVSPSSPISFTPSFTVDFVKSDKSLALEEPPLVIGSQEVFRSQESPQSLRSTSGLRSPMASVIIRPFSPEQPASREQLQPQTDSESLLPRGSSGFGPKSVVVQQSRSQELPDAEESMLVLGAPQEEPEGPPRVRPERRRVADKKHRRGASRGKRIHSLQPSAERSELEIFLTQLDESQYQEPERKVPFFILPFRDMEWFKKLFPKGFPPEWSLNDFLIRLLESLLTANYGMKTEIVGAIAALQEDLWGEMNGMVHDALLHILNNKEDPPSMQDRTQKKFILAALRALLKVNKDSKDLMVELMTYYLQAPDCTRAAIRILIRDIGIQDPHNHFCQEMESWRVEADLPKEAVREVCSQWLEGALRELQEHRRSILEQELQLKMEQSLEIYLKELRAQAEDQQGQTEEKGDSTESYPETEEAALHWVEFQTLRPIDAINYFLEKQLKKDLEEMKQLASRAVVEAPRDTVMALPPVQKGRAILRLGETNVMLRKRIPPQDSPHPGFCFPNPFSRYVMKGFAPFVKLSLPKITLDPFPSDMQRPASPKTFTDMQQMVRKYFVPKFSYADSYP
ncbi:WD repeat-containing protein 97 isoform X2 [Hemicordylus capensis]|uniref:WD repeat-containing protein 97 isoform X2 n=1 Tax=Hemicordylus capensis TaxID=884348 RepID=UPI0023027A19|nr:WD repeat-containing protein 97 isoform X2 [Hemicordylus capensis]